MTRLYGRSPRGQRRVDAVPHGYWKTSTFIGAQRDSGRDDLNGHGQSPLMIAPHNV
jgi:hypothetical protein